jgi:hypothetical protein
MNNETKWSTMKRTMTWTMMLVIGEGVYYANDLWRSWAELNGISQIKTNEDCRRRESDTRGFRQENTSGEPAVSQTPIRAYAVDEKLRASAWNANASTDGNGKSDVLVEAFKYYDEKLFTPASITQVGPSTPIKPFIYYARQERRRAFRDDAAPVSARVVVVQVDDIGGVACAVAAIDDQIVFIPLADYKAAGLPTR